MLFRSDNESTDNRYPVFKLDAGDITNWWRTPIEKDDPSRDSLLSYEGTIKIADPYSDDPAIQTTSKLLKRWNSKKATVV